MFYSGPMTLFVAIKQPRYFLFFFQVHIFFQNRSHVLHPPYAAHGPKKMAAIRRSWANHLLWDFFFTLNHHAFATCSSLRRDMNPRKMFAMLPFCGKIHKKVQDMIFLISEMIKSPWTSAKFDAWLEFHKLHIFAQHILFFFVGRKNTIPSIFSCWNQVHRPNIYKI